MKFSIRDLLLVTVIVALVVGWWLDHSATTGETRRLAEEAERFEEIETMAKFDRKVYAHLEEMLDKSVPDWRDKVMEKWEPPDWMPTIPPKK